MKKAKVIGDARACVSVCIDEFWRGIDIDQENLVLDADQLASILTYCIIKSKFVELPGHIKFIEEFTG